MWEIRKHFKEHSARERIAKFLLESGFSVKDGEIYCNGVKMSPLRIAREVGVDRRTVRATVDTIEESEELSTIFSNLKSTAFLKDVAPKIGAGMIEIIPEDPHGVGILTGVTEKISELDISVRQSITEDPDFVEEPKLYVITESSVPVDAVEDIREVDGVSSVVLY